MQLPQQHRYVLSEVPVYLICILVHFTGLHGEEKQPNTKNANCSSRRHHRRENLRGSLNNLMQNILGEYLKRSNST